MTTHELALLVGGAFSGTVAVSALLVADQRTVGWLVGVVAQAALLAFALVTRTWTLVAGPCVVGPVFVRNWLTWRRRDRARGVSTTSEESRSEAQVVGGGDGGDAGGDTTRGLRRAEWTSPA